MVEIPKDKEKNILEVSIKEFAKNSYSNASTNIIAKESGISKGSLFDYFGSKLNLYLYMVDKVIKKYEEAMMPQLENLSNDMFERVYETQMIKLKLSYELPEETKIISDFFLSDIPEIKQNFDKYYNYYEKVGYGKLTKGIDYSKFKEGVDVDTAYNTLLYISFGYIEMLQRKYKNNGMNLLRDIEYISEDLRKSINLVKIAVYK